MYGGGCREKMEKKKRKGKQRENTDVKRKRG